VSIGVAVDGDIDDAIDIGVAGGIVVYVVVGDAVDVAC